MKREVRDAVAARITALHNLKFTLEKALNGCGYTGHDVVFGKVLYVVDCEISQLKSSIEGEVPE